MGHYDDVRELKKSTADTIAELGVKVGNSYKTRDGRIAIVREINEGHLYPIVADVYYQDDSFLRHTFTEHGSFYMTEENGLDLMIVEEKQMELKVGQLVELRNGDRAFITRSYSGDEKYAFELTHFEDDTDYGYTANGCWNLDETESLYDVVKVLKGPKEEETTLQQPYMEAHGYKWKVTHNVTSEDMVKKPNHKILFADEELGIEINNIQVIASALTHERFIGFILGQIMDYRFRAGKKWDKLEEDINKADYLMELYHKYKHLTTDYGLVVNK